MTDVQDVRRNNLRELLAGKDGGVLLARKLKLANSSYLFQVVSGHRPFSEKTARKWESLLGLKPGWFDEDHCIDITHIQVKTPEVSTNQADLKETAMVVLTALEHEGLHLSAEKTATLLALVHEEAQRAGQPSLKFANRVIQLLK